MRAAVTGCAVHGDRGRRLETWRLLSWDGLRSQNRRRNTLQDLSITQAFALNLAMTLMVCVILFKCPNGYSLIWSRGRKSNGD
ncbi:hypothetical protein [Novosphingopyxis sp.]|uniref:hypothetical protein n=1 Tax=Novosphingopyxis sp. TaxID=2709690 RepID=UPI003B5C005B